MIKYINVLLIVKVKIELNFQLFNVNIICNKNGKSIK